VKELQAAILREEGLQSQLRSESQAQAASCEELEEEIDSITSLHDSMHADLERDRASLKTATAAAEKAASGAAEVEAKCSKEFEAIQRELEECVEECSRAKAAKAAADKRSRTIDFKNASLEARLTHESDQHKRKQASRNESTEVQAEALTARLSKLAMKQAKLLKKQEKANAKKAALEQKTLDILANSEDFKSQLEKVTQELAATREAASADSERAKGLEAELIEHQRVVDSSRARLGDASSARDAALGCAERAGKKCSTLEVRLQTLQELTQNLADRKGGAWLGDAVAKLKGDCADELLALRKSWDALDNVAGWNSDAQDQCSRLEAGNQELRARFENLEVQTERAKTSEASLHNQLSRLEALVAQRGASSDNAQDAQSGSAVQTDAQPTSADGEVASPDDAGTAALHESFAKLIARERAGAERLAGLEDALASELSSRNAVESRGFELRRRLNDLKAECLRHTNSIVDLKRQVGRERAQSDEARTKQQERCDAIANLEEQYELSTSRASSASESLTQERSMTASIAQQMQAFQHELGGFADQERACKADIVKLSARLEKSQTKQRKVNQQVEGLQAKLDEVRPVQQELRRKLDDATAQLETLASEKEVAMARRGELKSQLQKAELEVAEQIHRGQQETAKALQEAGPTQLSSADVLISVSFQGILEPLKLMPWDTDLEAVVREWLSTSHKSLTLQPSVVRYLTHLEQTATAYPVRVEASLLEVHQEFALE